MDCLRDYVLAAELATGEKMKVLRSNNGTEYVNKEVRELLSEHNILHKTNVVGKSQQNSGRTTDAAQSLLYGAKMPTYLYWARL